MDIHFKTAKLKKILTNERLIKKSFAHAYQGILNRFSELQAVSNLSLISHLPPPRKHKLSGKFEGCWAVDVSSNERLVFTSVNSEKDALDEEITAIEILEITDYH